MVLNPPRHEAGHRHAHRRPETFWRSLCALHRRLRVQPIHLVGVAQLNIAGVGFESVASRTSVNPAGHTSTWPVVWIDADPNGLTARAVTGRGSTTTGSKTPPSSGRLVWSFFGERRGAPTAVEYQPTAPPSAGTTTPSARPTPPSRPSKKSTPVRIQLETTDSHACCAPTATSSAGDSPATDWLRRSS